MATSNMDALLSTHKFRREHIFRREVLQVVQESDKQRFEIDYINDKEMIRATQGHSLRVDKDLIQNRLSQAELPITLYHGTYSSCYRSIASNGLLAGGPHKSRTDIHLIQHLPGTGNVISGMRTDCDIALVVSPQAAAEAGCTFYRSSNGVFLTEGLEGILPPKFIRAVIIMETRELVTSECATAAPSWNAVCEGLLRAEQLYMTVSCSGHVTSHHVIKGSPLLSLALQEPTNAPKRPGSSAEQRPCTHPRTCQEMRGRTRLGQPGSSAKHRVTQLLSQTPHARLGKPPSAPTRTPACLGFPKSLLIRSDVPKSLDTGTHVAPHHQSVALRHCKGIGRGQHISAGSEATSEGTPHLQSLQGGRSATQRLVQSLSRVNRLPRGESSYRIAHRTSASPTLSCPARSMKGVEDQCIRPLPDMKKPAAKNSRTAPEKCLSIVTTTRSGHRRPLQRSRLWAPREASHRTSSQHSKKGEAGRRTWIRLAQQIRPTRTVTHKTYSSAGDKIRRTQKRQAPHKGVTLPKSPMHWSTLRLVRAAQPHLIHTEIQQDRHRHRHRHSSDMTLISPGQHLSTHRQEGHHHQPHADQSPQTDQSMTIIEAKACSQILSGSRNSPQHQCVNQSSIVAGLWQPRTGAIQDGEVKADRSETDSNRQPAVRQSAHAQYHRNTSQVKYIEDDSKIQDPSDHHAHAGHEPPWFIWTHGLYVGLLGICSSGQRRRRAKASRLSRHRRQLKGSEGDKSLNGGSQQHTPAHWRAGVRQALHKLVETYSPNNPFLGRYTQDARKRRKCRSQPGPPGRRKLRTLHIACLCTVWIAFLVPLGTQVTPHQIAAVSDKLAPASALAAVYICCPTSTESPSSTGMQQTQPEQAHSNSVHKWYLAHNHIKPHYNETDRTAQEDNRIASGEQQSGGSLIENTTTHSSIGNRHRLPTAHRHRAQSQPGPKSGTGAIKVMITASILPGSCGVRVPGASTPSGRPSPQTHLNQYFVGKRVEGATVQNASRAAHRSFSVNSIWTTNRRAQPRRGGRQPRFRIFTLNVGGLSAFMWADLKAFISGPGLKYDAVLLQETHRTQSSEFRTAGWSAIGSASKSKADGLMTLIHPKHNTGSIKHEEIVPGRLQRVQVIVEGGRVEILNAYQHVWSYTDSTEINTSRRQRLLDKISQTIQSIARRHTLILAGDLNAELTRSHPYTGNALAHTQRHVGPGSAEPLALTRMVEEAQLIALNTFHASPPQTYFGVHGASQIDYIMTRSESTDYEAKQVKIFEPQIGGWKELGHRALSASIRVTQHFHLHPKNPHSYPFDKTALDAAVRGNTAEAAQLRQKVQEALETAPDAQHPDDINGILLEVTQEVFPRKPKQATVPDPCFVHLWEHRRKLRNSKPIGPRGFFNFWRSWAAYNNKTKELRRKNIQQKRDYTSQQLQEAERYHRNGNQGGLYKVVRALAPWRPRQRIQLRSDKGQLLDHQAEHDELVEHCKTLYKTEETDTSALGSTGQIPAELDLIAKQLAGAKMGKAVPLGAAPSSTWRCCAEVVAPRIQSYIQYTANAGGCFPPSWTDATLALLPKPQKPANRPGNLRAIGLIRPDGKAVAGAMKTHITAQTSEWLRWVPQFSYQSGRDIADCLVRVQHAIQQAESIIKSGKLDRFAKRCQVEEGKYDPTTAPALQGCIIFSVDLSKAFDMVDRQKLGRALALAGVEPCLVQAVLELHRRAKYQVNSGPYSTTVGTARGIRQGCTLAPTLWTILSAQLIIDLAQKVGESAFTAFTAFADDQVGHWNIQNPEEIATVDRQVATFLQILEDYGLKINPDKSKLLVRLQGTRAKSVIKKNTLKVNNQKCWNFDGDRGSYQIPLAEELSYLGTIISVRRSSATLSLQHRLAEADKRTSCLRRSIRSRRIIPVHTRLSIWKTCVLSSALHGLHALKLSSADLQKLSQWYHRQVRAVTHTPAHITKISNRELRDKYGLESPEQILHSRATAKLGKLQSKAQPDITSTSQALTEWENIVAHYKQMQIMSEVKLTAVDNRALEQAQACPECGLYFSSIKTVRQHMARKHGLKVEAVVGIQYRAEQHSVKGMPQCRHCGSRFSSMGVLRTHIITDACGWHSATQVPTEKLPDLLNSFLPGREAAAATAPEQQPRPSDATTDGPPQGQQPADSQQETSGGSGERTTSSDQGQALTEPCQSANAPDTTGQPPERSQAAASSAGRCPYPRGAAPSSQVQEGDVSLFADARTRALARDISNLTTIATNFADKLRRHCLVCNHWVVDLNTVKTHILRSHTVAWHKCNPSLNQSHSAFEKELKRDFACPYCGKTVFGVARHLTQCPVIMQVAFLHQLAIQEIDPYATQAVTVDISSSQAAQLLTNYEDARASEQLPGLLHKCYSCQADVHDLQTWRRHMKQNHSQVWKQVEGHLKNAVMAQPLPRPCPYCKTQYQKTPAVHVGKCLALQQLLAIRESPPTQIEHDRRSRADSSTMGEPKPTGPRASQESTEARRRQGREQIREEPSTAEANDTTDSGGSRRRSSNKTNREGP